MTYERSCACHTGETPVPPRRETFFVADQFLGQRYHPYAMTPSKRSWFATEQIQLAFGQMRPPVATVEMVGYPARCTYPSINSVLSRFGGKAWHQTKAGDFDPYETLQGSLSDEATGYYFPGLLTSAIREGDRELAAIVPGTLGIGFPREEWEPAEPGWTPRSGFETYTPEQFRSVAIGLRALVGLARSAGDEYDARYLMSARDIVRRHARQAAPDRGPEPPRPRTSRKRR